MAIWHLTYSAEGRNPLFPTSASLFDALWALRRVAGQALALYCIVDDHVHLVIVAERERVGRVARAVLLALRATSETRLAPAFIRHVNTRAYMEWVFSYVLSQPAKHKLPGHPALCSGNCFLDLVGARNLINLQHSLRQALPRYHSGYAFQVMELPRCDQGELRPGAFTRYDIERLARATEQAACVLFQPGRRSARLLEARTTLAHLARAGGIRDERIAERLGVTNRTVRSLRKRSVPEPLLGSVQRHLALEDCVATSVRHSGTYKRIRTSH